MTRSQGLIITCALLAGCAGPGSDGANENTSQAYRRPFGPNAPWNVPARDLPRHEKSDVYARRLWEGASRRPGNWNLTFDGYTYPVYYAGDAEERVPVRTKRRTNIDGTMIPRRSDWRPPHGTDAQIIIIDRARGWEWDMWQVERRGDTLFASNGNLVQAGENPGDGSDPANIWTKENGFRPSRGIGIQYLAMLVRPEEIVQGEIRHALSMPIINTDGEVFVPPATKLEHPDHPGDQVPEGMRFALDVTDAEIDTWIRSLPRDLPEGMRRAARIIAAALRDYGWFITDTSGGAHLQFESRVTAGDQWTALGLDDLELGGQEYPRDLLDGLITQDRIYTLVPSDRYPR